MLTIRGQPPPPPCIYILILHRVDLKLRAQIALTCSHQKTDIRTRIFRRHQFVNREYYKKSNYKELRWSTHYNNQTTIKCSDAYSYDLFGNDISVSKEKINIF